MDFVLKVITGLLCESITFFFFYQFHSYERAAIIESGYCNNNKLYKPEPNHLPFWNRLLYWDLCKQTRHNPAAVWFYFVCNLIVCLGWIISVVVCIFCVFTMEIRDILLHQLGYMIGAFFIWGIVHFIADLLFLPSVQKRYNFNKKKK